MAKPWSCPTTPTESLKDVVSLVIWAAYLAAGSLIFVHLEYDHHVAESSKRLQTVENRLFEIWQLGAQAGLNQRQHPLGNDTAAVHALINDIVNALGLDPLYEWDFAGGIHFCLSVVSTIGYGHLAPGTSTGRSICIFYGLVGIPLNCLVMARLSRFIVAFTNALYHGLLKIVPSGRWSSGCYPLGRRNEDLREGTGTNSSDAREERVRENRGISQNTPGVTNTADSAVMYRSDLYGLSESTRFGLDETSRNKVGQVRGNAWTEVTAIKSHANIINDSSASSSASSSSNNQGNTASRTLVDDTTETGDNERHVETVARAPVWFACVVTFALMLSVAAFLYTCRTVDLGDNGYTYIDWVYYAFVTMSTIGFGDIGIGHMDVVVVPVSVIIDVITTMVGLLTLSALIDSAMRVNVVIPRPCTAVWTRLRPIKVGRDGEGHTPSNAVEPRQ